MFGIPRGINYPIFSFFSLNKHNKKGLQIYNNQKNTEGFSILF